MQKSWLRQTLSQPLKRLRYKLFSRTYELLPLERLSGAFTAESRVILPKRMIKGSRPRFIGGETCDLSDYDGTIVAPEVRLYRFTEVSAVGRTELIFKDGTAYFPQVLAPRLYAFMCELEGRGRVYAGHDKMTLHTRARSQRVDSAISLLSQCNGNYAHWITEVLARLVLIDQIDELHDLPLLVDHPVHEKLVHALEVMNEGRRRIIPVRNYERVHAKALVYVTLPSVTPPETRRFFETQEIDDPRADQFQFSRDALSRLSDTASAIAGDYGVIPRFGLDSRSSPRLTQGITPEDLQPRLVYLCREAYSTGNGRIILNEDGVKAMLSWRGFAFLDIYRLSFELQVQALQKAEVVVSPIGAALANLVFCPPGCQVIILSPFYHRASFHYFANLMTALGHSAIFVLGPQAMQGSGSIYNRDYLVRLSQLEEALAMAGMCETEDSRAIGPSRRI